MEWAIGQSMWKGDVDTLQKAIIHQLEEDKADEIAIIDLEGKTSFADRMIIADGRSVRHVSSVADSLVKELKELGLDYISLEGTETCDWVLIDAGDIVVHLFRPGVREIYNLEKMWAIAPRDTQISDGQLLDA